MNMELLPEIINRKSPESFTGEKIDPELLEKILEAGHLAPSAKNRQAWRFILVQEDKIKKELKDYAFGNEMVENAGALIALCPTDRDFKMINGEKAYPIDIGIAAAFMTLQAEHLGIRSRMISNFNQQEVKELLSIPYSINISLIILLGYSQDNRMRSKRKSTRQIFGHEHW